MSAQPPMEIGDAITAYLKRRRLRPIAIRDNRLVLGHLKSYAQARGIVNFSDIGEIKLAEWSVEAAKQLDPYPTEAHETRAIRIAIALMRWGERQGYFSLADERADESEVEEWIATAQ